MPYIKEVFDVTTLDHAKHVVLTSDPNDPNKFERETNFLVEVIAKNIQLTETTKVLDFGCGMGRVSKPLVDNFNCNVVGVDISPSMLNFARLYVRKPDKFTATHTYDVTESIDVAISILVLQHTENPRKEIENIINVLKPGGYLVILNERIRYVPSDVTPHNGQDYIVWNDDKFDIFGEISTRLKLVNTVKYINPELDINIFRK
jgi:2-polyprenyl-3-methyl-5-hydroxy-6-metoxy-1,4-benzoquinol methylase